MSRGAGKTMRPVHYALIKADEGWLTINELVEIVYPEPATWQQHERRRFAVRKAVSALAREWVEGVRIVRDGSGSDERVRADLTKWTGRYIKTPRKRNRRPSVPGGTTPLDAGPRRPVTTDSRWSTMPYGRAAGQGALPGPCRICDREDKCPDFLSGGWPEECRRCGHLASDHGR